jgi:hypothetical protein
MIVIGGGGGNVDGDVGGDGMGAESIDQARKETCSGKELKATAHVIPRPSQSSRSGRFAVIGWCTFAPMSVPS